MAKAALVCTALVMAAAVPLRAENFPLQFKAIPAQDVLSFPGGNGRYNMLSTSRPSDLKQEPKASSKHPLYAQVHLASDNDTVVVRLDESKGDGKGYDQLLVDVNQNGNLTDETPVTRAASPQGQQSGGVALFGPIAAAPGQSVAAGRPVFFAQAYLYERQTVPEGGTVLPGGMLSLKAGWYLETTVNLDGVKRTLGVYDANANLRLGELPKNQILRSSGRDTGWTFNPGDVWLVDADRSGRFESDVLQSEAVPFGPLLYLGAKAYKVTLASDFQTVGVEPWTEPLAEVTLAPHSEQVHSVTLAWERQGGQWQLIRPTVVAGKIQVPPGNYRLYQCNLLGKAGSGEPVAVTATERATRMPFNFVAGKANKLECGGPLEVKVTAAKTRIRSGQSLFGGLSSSGSADAVRISTQVVGAEGEVYSGYYTGNKLRERPPQPTFTVQDEAGKEVGQGKLEYG